jgi:hypothetical protein
MASLSAEAQIPELPYSDEGPPEQPARGSGGDRSNVRSLFKVWKRGDTNHTEKAKRKGKMTDGA